MCLILLKRYRLHSTITFTERRSQAIDKFDVFLRNLSN